MSIASPLLLPVPLLLRTRGTPASREAGNLGRDALADAGVIPSEARITVSRQSTEDVGFREIFVAIDGEQLAILRHGDAVSTEVPSGPHRIRAHNTLFWKTHDLVLKPGEHAKFTAVNKAGWGTFGLLFILGAMPVYLTFERVTSDIPSHSAPPSP